MTAKTDFTASDNPTASNAAASSSPNAESPSALSTSNQTKPRFAIFIATAAGLGYFPKAPGTLGSLGGFIVFAIPACLWFGPEVPYMLANGSVGDFSYVNLPADYFDHFVWAYIVLFLLVSVVGVWAAHCAAEFWRQKDPGRVVIDEVSGQFLTMLLGSGVPIWWRIPGLRYATLAPGFTLMRSALNWKYLLLGFILFRVFDIWKPFPARQAESLPGGWGIMADDWIAGIYAAIGLWLARAAGL
jgi:phosphatidylglycerophosphatase A